MKKLILTILVALSPLIAHAAGESCVVALDPLTPEERVRLVNQLLDSEILLGRLQLDAVKKAANVKLGLNHDIRNGEWSERSKLAAFAPHLRWSGGEADRAIQLSFAEQVFKELKEKLKPIQGETAYDRTRDIEYRIYDGRRLAGSLLPSAKHFENAVQVFQAALATEAGRDVIFESLLVTNDALVRVLAKTWARLRDYRRKEWYLLSTALGWLPAGAAVGLAAAITPYSPGVGALVGAVGIGPAASLAAWSAAKTQAPGRARLLLARALRARLVKKIAEGSVSLELPQKEPGAKNQGPTKSASPPPLAVAKVVNQAESRVRKKLDELDPRKVNLADFRSIGSYGDELNDFITVQAETWLLMTEQAERFGEQIERLAEASRQNTSKGVNTAVDAALASSLEIMSSAIDYSATVEKLLAKLDDFIAFGKESAAGLDAHFRDELLSATQELESSALHLQPVRLQLPNLLDLTKTQRETLRELRAELRNKKLSDDGVAQKIEAAIAKLRSTRTSLVEHLTGSEAEAR